jgi:membrane-bound metal-dependent hydrolase YbcI (DUF457 family)
VFIGHFGLAFAAKRVAPQVSVGTTIFAAEFLDSVWPILVLTGVERVEIVPGITRVTPLDFVYYPWSHSLAAALAWAALFAGTYWLLRRNSRNALWLGALVASHWLLDWIVHRPDKAAGPGEAQGHGLGLWNSLAATFAIEFGLFAAGIVIYLRNTRARDRTGTFAFWALVAVLVVSYLGATLGPPPPSAQVVAGSALIGYLMVAWGWWIDRHREPARS